VDPCRALRLPSSGVCFLDVNRGAEAAQSRLGRALAPSIGSHKGSAWSLYPNSNVFMGPPDSVATCASQE
jgi:hypothetical protein